MKILSSAIAATLLLATTGVAQNLIAMPAHASIYNGFSRGFAFTAQSQFFINTLDLPVDAFQAGDTGGYLVLVNGVQALHSIGNASSTTTNLLINQGDLVQVIGNWSPAVPGNFTAHNSYGSGGGTYTTPIEGTSTLLQRTGWQWDIGDPAFAGGVLAPTSGSMGRVDVYTNPPTGLYAGFSSDVQTGPSPLTVNFSDNSFSSDPGGVSGWAWDFENDGTIDSTAQNPQHIYTACGTYDVSLTAFDASHPFSTIVQTAFISTDVTTADFSEALIAPLVVQFTDTSTGNPTSWDWDLDGDGTTDSTAQNPAWAYLNANAVNVTLTVARLCGPTSTVTKTVVPLQSLSTGFAPNNANGNYGSVMFDLDVLNPAGLTIGSLDIHTTTAGPVNLDMYVRQGTYNNFWSTPEEWVLVGTATGTTVGGGYTVPENLTFTSPVYLPPGLSGVKLHYRDFYCQYTTGTGVVPFGNSDVTMTVGTSQYTTTTNAFTGGTITPRWFGGTIYYETHNLSGNAQAGNYGPGCAGALGVPGLSASATPAIGTSVTLTIDNMAAPEIGILLMGLSHVNSILGPLPLDGTSLGAPTCFLRASPDVNQLLVGAAGAATANFTIANDPSLSGLKVFAQGAVLDPAANAAGVVLSDANAMLIGN